MGKVGGSKNKMNSLKILIRPLVHNLHAYVPGEQPEVDFDAVMP